MAIQAERCKSLHAGLRAILCPDIELFDRVANLVDAKGPVFCTFHQMCSKLLGRKAKCLVLHSVLIEGIEQIPVLVRAVLGCISNQIERFLPVNAKVLHQGRRCSGCFVDIHIKCLAKSHRILRRRLKFLAVKPPDLLDRGHRSSDLVKGFPHAGLENGACRTFYLLHLLGTSPR